MKSRGFMATKSFNNEVYNTLFAKLAGIESGMGVK
jgi:hypothetical protein